MKKYISFKMMIAYLNEGSYFLRNQIASCSNDTSEERKQFEEKKRHTDGSTEGITRAEELLDTAQQVQKLGIVMTESLTGNNRPEDVDDGDV